tara:strand:+ start:109 stop:480 length:372 start_codon:yes stop_codon:yes gene_type:complete
MLTLKMTKHNGKIIYKNDSDKLRYRLFVDKLKEGQDLEFFVDVVSKKASTAQITKVHTCIRLLAGEAGYTFDEMKSIVKEKAGLYIEGEEDLKSFAHCSKDEITMAIEVCNEIGRDFNMDFIQ